MRISVVIPSYNRAAVLHDTVTSVLSQSVIPTEIILALANPDHVEDRTLRLPGVVPVVAKAGLPHQRNAGIRAIRPDADLVAFFDDDVELAPDYLEKSAATFNKFPNLCLLTGWVLEDGVRTGGLQREAARAVIASRQSPPGAIGCIEPMASAYGCNMVVRRSALETVSFDERLPLYAWLEDLDFSFWCGQLGFVARSTEARIVHLGVSSGRVSGRRYGFSQMVNPFYLNRKGSLPFRFRILMEYWLRPLAMNAAMSLLPARRIDRRGRLIGNLIGISQLVRGHVTPEYILKMR